MLGDTCLAGFRVHQLQAWTPELHGGTLVCNCLTMRRDGGHSPEEIRELLSPCPFLTVP